METYKILEWDSVFFGFTVARILPKKFETQELKTVLGAMKDQGIRLAYWGTDPADNVSNDASKSCKGFLADRKTTYVINADAMRKRLGLVIDETDVDLFTELVPSSELEDLAIQAGLYSRFRLDPRIPEHCFKELYRLWIQKSVSGELAEKVFVVRDAGKIVGMTTVGEKDGRGDIGLLAVDNSMRGKSLGGKMVLAAQKWALGRGFQVAQVVTQGDNLPACRFYEKSGYHVDKVEHIHHFWSCE